MSAVWRTATTYFQEYRAVIGINEESPGMTELGRYVHEAFSPNGIFSRAADFEYRPQQQQMAMSVAHALESGSPLLVEAGTGVGKSLGYLLPSLKFALSRDRKAVVSTHTINLQEQLIKKDLPILREAMGAEFSAALLKGRGNYLCLTRLRRAMEQADDLFSTYESEELKRIQEWSLSGQGGTLSDMPFFPSSKVWSLVCSEPHICTMKYCGPNCPYQVARKRVLDADVVVLNHTLFFSLLSQAEENELEEGFVFPGDFLILDEAHTIENIAARQLGVQLSESHIKYELLRMFNPKTKKGVLRTLGDARLLQQVTEVQEACDVFFENVREDLGLKEKRRTIRLREPEWTENVLNLPVAELVMSLKKLSDDTEHEITRSELQDMALRMQSIRENAVHLLELSDDNSVYWAEPSGQGGKNTVITSAPVEVDAILREKLFSSNRAVILTSATLGTGEEGMGYFAGRIGAEAVEKIQIGSPFDYKEQMRLVVARSMPEPDDEHYETELAEWVKRFLEESDGRAFVLFTSYRLMQETARKVSPFCEEKGWKVYVQGHHLPRHAMLQAFREDVHSVLFGTDSFWTGVDVPGEALSNVIVTRLPFEVPDHPLVESRFERIRERGGVPFMEYSLPEAVLKLRQGVGRLIRTRKDKGMVVILDSRLAKKRYGARFLKALPDAGIEYL